MPSHFPTPGFSAHIRATSPLVTDALTGVLLDLGAGEITAATTAAPLPAAMPDLVIVQLRAGDNNDAIEELSTLRERGCPARVVYTPLPTTLTRRRLAAARPTSVVLDTTPTRLVTDCLAAALTGRRWLDADLPPEIVDESSWLDLLSPRELDVLARLPVMHRPADIAADLGVATGTVSVHLRNLRGKSGIHSCAGLAVAATLAGLAT